VSSRDSLLTCQAGAVDVPCDGCGVTVAQSAVEPAAEDVGICRLVRCVDAPGELVEGRPVIELAFERSEALGESDRRVWQQNGRPPFWR
jgi:hypothetical protein